MNILIISISVFCLGFLFGGFSFKGEAKWKALYERAAQENQTMRGQMHSAFQELHARRRHFLRAAKLLQARKRELDRQRSAIMERNTAIEAIEKKLRGIKDFGDGDLKTIGVTSIH